MNNYFKNIENLKNEQLDVGRILISEILDDNVEI